MSSPKITIITSVFNGAGTLQRCIDSVAGQSWPVREHIVIDGGSDDGSVDILKANSDKLAYWESRPDRGIYHAWNKGLRHASGDWVIFLGADDCFHDEHVLERFVASLGEHPEAMLLYGRVEQVDERGRLVRELGAPWDVARKDIRSRMSIPHPGCFYRRDLFGTYGFFDETFRIAGDYDFVLRVLADVTPVFLDGLVVARMRVGGVSCDPSSTCRMLMEDRLAQRKNGIGPFFSPMYCYRIAKHYIRGLSYRRARHLS